MRLGLRGELGVEVVEHALASSALPSAVPTMVIVSRHGVVHGSSG